MRRRSQTIWLVWLILALLTTGLLPAQAGHQAPAAPAIPMLPAPPAQASVFHRGGQTFLTWPEVPDGGAVTYRIYRQPGSAGGSPDPGALVAEVPQGSAIYWTERGRAPIATDNWLYPGLSNYVITNLGPQLADGTGLLVWTAHEAGEFTYTVQPTINGAPDNSRIMVIGPVGEAPGAPEPVLVWQSGDGNARVYTQFMDYASYNATFDAPRPGNDWLGLGPVASASPVARHFQQYAYNYFLGLPTEQQCGGPVWDSLPLMLEMSGYKTRYLVSPSSPWFCAVHIRADDPSQSWYFGFSASHDYRTNRPVTTGPIVNYTEERLQRTVHEALRNPEFRLDPERVYAYGHSMGGTGALQLAERYPNVFAAVFASEPMTNYAVSAMWVSDAEAKWGRRGLNLPIENRGPYAGAVAGYNGAGVWWWQNLALQTNARRSDEMAYIWISHGLFDSVMDWSTQGEPVYNHLYAGNRAFAGRIDPVDHVWVDLPNSPMGGLSTLGMRRNESLPAFSNASDSLPIPPGSAGGFNLSLEWSTWWYNFGPPPVDVPTVWAVTIRSTSVPQVVDVTPRRVQQFVITPGATYNWRNEAMDGTVIAAGTVTVDPDGLITVPQFAVSLEGNRLVIEPAG